MPASAAEKRVRWSVHAEAALIDRAIARAEVEMTVRHPEFRVPDRLPPDDVVMRRYVDANLGRMALLRVVIHETPLEIVIVTECKATRMERYLRGLV